jgi:putative transposase
MRKFRSVLGHRVTDAPLERAEIDHTPLDLMVVDDDTCLPLGRPYLTACIDDFTRCILGIFVSFEPPSYLTVARCLKDSFLPKLRLGEFYPEVRGAWDAHGVMRELVVDNGAEFHSNSLELACFTLGIEIHYAPRKTGWFKAKIERFLGSANRGVAHGNPGTTFSNVLEKEDYDPSKHAIIRLSALQQMLRVWIVDYYHQKPHRGLGVSPSAKWASSINPDDILVPDDPARLDAILGRVETRVLSHKGIELDWLQYNSPDLAELRKRFGDRLDVEIRVDDADIGKIFVLSPDKKTIFEANCLSHEYANGLSRWQHKVCRRFADRNIGVSNPMAWLRAKETIAQIIEGEMAHRPRKSAKRIGRFKGVRDIQSSQPETEVLEQNSTVVAAEQPSDILPVTRSETNRKRFQPIMRDRSRSVFVADLDQGTSHE